ncbi:dehydrogenase/reductase SDR family member 7B isoform X3 [Falco rusticolus]|uniref:dehydrogenase/reductase SDR family member 7B isoform X3 n=1 Tax=Falco rusticolus TaxID=120794 RepID=UPI001886930F|nr:dehydrogenase/reductase SDR family member 7B isoform X3 [Falco rusticolus]
MVMAVARKTVQKGKLMDLTSTVIIPLLFGSLGIFALFRLLQWMRMRAYLREAVVVITGATSGLGKECAKAFHAAGSKLVLCGRDSEKLKDLVQELSTVTNHRKNTHKPHTVIFDLSDTKTVLNAAEEILKYLGHVDILINNAGISFRGIIVDTGLDVDKKVMETNYFGPVALTKDAASKHATQAFFDCLRAEVEQYDIDVTVISPGYIQTNLSLNAVTADGSRYGVTDKNTAEGQTAAEVAQVVLNAVGQKRKEVLVAGLTPSLAVYLRNLFPRLFFTLMAARAKKERKAKDS